MFPHLKGFNLKQWIDENRGDWGQRRVIWQDSDFIAFVTRGPNRRKDFHINPGDEIFYQLEGDLNLHYIKDNKRELATLQAGDIFLLPKNTPHSPRRADGSWTYVVERQRGKEQRDGNRAHYAAVSRATSSLKSNPALATCKQCGEVMDL